MSLIPAGILIADEIARIRPRALRLTSFDLNSATNIALAALRVGGTKAAAFVDGFSDAVEAHGQALQTIPISLVLELVTRQPRFLALESVWRRPLAQQASLCAIFANPEIVAELSVRRIIDAILSAKAWYALTVACEQFGREAILSIVQWIDAREDELLSIPEPVNQILAVRAPLIAELIITGVFKRRSLKAMSALLDARANEIRQLGAAYWIPIAEKEVRFTDTAEELRSRAFMLAIGLACHNVKLISGGFSDVYEAARANELPLEEFEMLEPFLPWYSPTWGQMCSINSSGGAKLHSRGRARGGVFDHIRYRGTTFQGSRRISASLERVAICSSFVQPGCRRGAPFEWNASRGLETFLQLTTPLRCAMGVKSFGGIRETFKRAGVCCRALILPPTYRHWS